MPQGRRKKPFSGKQKKRQLQMKRQGKQAVARVNDSSDEGNTVYDDEEEEVNVNCKLDVEELNFAPGRKNRYNLKFHKEKVLDKEQDKDLIYCPITSLPNTILESSIEIHFPSILDYPRRPEWSECMSRDQLEANEQKYFRHFCKELDKRNRDADNLSLYELNLETWRQLWRVTEMADVLVLIVDARFPTAHFPPYLYHHLVEKECKHLILVLNKCDLLPSSLVLAWIDFFECKYPQLSVIPFSSLEGKAMGKTTLKMATQGAMRLVEACKGIVKDEVDLHAWQSKIEEEQREIVESQSESTDCHIKEESIELEYYFPSKNTKRFKDGILTLGTIGHPNVGKSSFINALMGKKVVSVSRTPGHTKHFQTIFLTGNVKLCDCPGLVFPSFCPRELQIVSGSYPIAQVRNPVVVLHYVAQRIDIANLLKLNPKSVDLDYADGKWTAHGICEAWAKRRSYFLRTKGGRLDVFRAANELLRFTLLGKKQLLFCLKPKNYFKNKAKYEDDERLSIIRRIQGVYAKGMKIEEDDEGGGSEEDEDNEESESGDDEKDNEPQASGNYNKFSVLLDE